MRALRARLNIPGLPTSVAPIAAAILFALFAWLLTTSGSPHPALLASWVVLVIPLAMLLRQRARLGAANRMLLMAEEMADFGYWRTVGDTGDTGEIVGSAQARAIAGIGDGPLSVAEALALVHPADRRPLLRCLAQARHGAPFECRARLRRADGKVRTIALNVQSDGRGKGGRPALFGVICDISDTVAAERKLIATRDSARAAAKAKSQFLATMSHEIRTPMTGVLGMIELLRGNPGPGDRAQYLDAMRKSSDLLMAILDDVLDFAKIEVGQAQPGPS